MTDEFARLLNEYLDTLDRTPTWLAGRLGVHPSTVNRWCNGEYLPGDPNHVTRAADILGIHDEKKRQEFLIAAGYGHVTSDWPATGIEAPVAEQPQSAHRHSTVAEVKRLGEAVFRWSEAPPHAQTSWAGMLLYSLSVLTERISARATLTLLVAITLWITTAWLMTPMLQWPLEDGTNRLIACVKYAAATLLVPCLVAAVTQPDLYDRYDADTPTRPTVVWVLKLTGALVGFYTFSGILIGLAMIWYYLTNSTLAAEVRGVLVLVPLLLSYVAARRIPADRYAMFGSPVQTHSADPLFLTVFLVAGPVTAAFFYHFFWLFTDRMLGGIGILLALFVVVWWEYRTHNM